MLEMTAFIAYGNEFNTTELFLKCCETKPVLFGQGKCLLQEYRSALSTFKDRMKIDDMNKVPSIIDGICLMYPVDFRVNVHMAYEVGDFASHSHESLHAFSSDLQWEEDGLKRKLLNGTMINVNDTEAVDSLKHKFEQCAAIWPYVNLGVFGREGPFEM